MGTTRKKFQRGWLPVRATATTLEKPVSNQPIDVGKELLTGPGIASESLRERHYWSTGIMPARKSELVRRAARGRYDVL